VLGRHGLACVSGWHSGRLARGTVADEIASVESHLNLLNEAGTKVMVYGEVADAIQGRPEALSRRPRFSTDAQWSAYGERLTELGRHLLARGIRLAYHHHMGAYVEAAEDVDRLMSVTGPEVGLLHDTGHATFAGSDGVYHVPVFAGTYRLVVDPNDGPAVKGNFIGTYPGGPLDFATFEVQVDGSLWTFHLPLNLPGRPTSLTAASNSVAVVAVGTSLWRQDGASWVSLFGGEGGFAPGMAPIYIE